MVYTNTNLACVVCGATDLVQIASLSRIPSSAQPFVDTVPCLSDRTSFTTSLTAFQCPNCSHVQAFTDLVPYYKNVISSASLSPVLTLKRDDKLSAFCSDLCNINPSIIEIGAFKGQYLRHLMDIGYDRVVGIENSCSSVLSAKNLGVSMQAGYLLDDDFINDTGLLFDIVLCFNFLEHVPDPFRFLQIIKNRFAAENSIFYFTMPSFQYIRSQSLLQEFVPDHISYFTPASLRILFERSNLTIRSLCSINNGNDLEIVASYSRISCEPISSIGLDSLISSINTEIDSAAEDCRSVVFWGAGHRSLTLISQLRYSLISFIVDSAPFKHDKFCPDTGLRIKAPSSLLLFEVDILFLSLPGVFASEVLEFLRSNDIFPSRLYLIEGNELIDCSIYHPV